MTRRLDEVYDLARTHMATWNVGKAIPAQTMLRPFLNAQASPLLASIDTQDEIADALKYKMRVLNVGLVKLMPSLMLKTLPMRRRAKAMQRIEDRMQSTHTAAQRVGMPEDVVDAYLALHAADPQFLPESDLSLPLRAILMTSMYMGDQLGFALYWLVQHPELYERVTAEADALWAEGDTSEDDLSQDRIDVTHRVPMESLRMSPIVAMSMRSVMNTCVVEGYELPVGGRLLIAQTAPHYMEEAFPDRGHLTSTATRPRETSICAQVTRPTGWARTHVSDPNGPNFTWRATCSCSRITSRSSWPAPTSGCRWIRAFTVAQQQTEVQAR